MARGKDTRNHPARRLENLLLQRANENPSTPFLQYVMANQGSRNALADYRYKRDTAQGIGVRPSIISANAIQGARDQLAGVYQPASEFNPLPDIANTVNMVFKTRHEGKQVRRNDGGAEQPPNLDEYPRGR